MLRLILLCGFCLTLPAHAADYKVGDRLDAPAQSAGKAREISWDDLLPPNWNPAKALEGLKLDQLSDEIGPDGGRAVGLLPGTVTTERIRYLHSQADDPDAARAAAAAAVPLRRLGRPDEFGRVAAFMLSDAASYVTGSMIAVDGGVQRAL